MPKTNIKILSWNVNSINARLENICKLINLHEPDILLLQELKAQEHNIPKSTLEDMGYNIAASAQKSYNGVAILSRYRMEDIFIKDFTGAKDEARYVEALVNANDKCIRIASIYIPNGQMVISPKFKDKLNFLSDMSEYFYKILKDDEIFVIGGDFNVAPYDIDVYNPVKLRNTIGFHQDECKAIHNLLDNGFSDTLRVISEKQIFSWWDYRNIRSFSQNQGMRVDYILTSKFGVKFIKNADVITETRAWIRPSDHAPVLCELEL